MKKDALILALITLVAGLLLGGVYEITKGPREKQKQIAQNKAYMAVYEDNDAYKDMDVSEFTFEELDVATLVDLDSKLNENGLDGRATIDGLVETYNSNNEHVGYVINVTAKGGYGGDISFSVGFDTVGTVTGISILSISETPGLGMKAKEDDFLKNFIDKIGIFAVDKDSPSEDENKVDSISGATITSRAMTDGVNAASIAYSCIPVLDVSFETESMPETDTTLVPETSATTETTVAGGDANE